ncbi:MAG: MFS transporter [Chloroflexi bacterium]|nr:MFS transporter [Chloroflexota bacterium]
MDPTSSRQSSPSPSLWANRDYKVLVAGQGMSSIGDAVSFTALPLLVLQLTGSGLAMGVVGMLEMLPDLVFGLPAGALADRWDRRRMMLLADLGRAILIALIPLSVLLGLPTMAVILAVTAPIHLLRVVFMAAFTASVPSLVGRDQIGPANSYLEALFSLGFILGPAIAGLLAAQIGPGPTLAIDACSFLLSGASLSLIKRPLRARSAPADTHLLAEIRDGISFVARHPVLRTTIAFWSSLSIASAPLIPALTFYMTVDRGLGPGALGLVISAYSIGSLLGALGASRLTRGRVGGLLLAGNAITGILLIAISSQSTIAPMLGMAFVAGISNSLVLITYITVRAAASPDELLGRVGSTARTISLGLQPLGYLAGGVILDLTGGATTMAAMGLVMFLVSGVFALSATLRGARVATSAPGPAVL